MCDAESDFSSVANHPRVVSCRFVDRKDFQYMEMDTDSAYMALSGRSIDEVVKPEMKESYYDTYGDWFPRPFCSEHRAAFKRQMLSGGEWTQMECCKAQLRFDRRTPGLFKAEFEGVGMVALNAKTYTCWDEDGGSKLSSKGLSKRTNSLAKDNYMEVLSTGRSQSGQNKGFVRKDNETFTYSQLRTGLTYFYAKRKVCEDGVTTTNVSV